MNEILYYLIISFLFMFIYKITPKLPDNIEKILQHNSFKFTFMVIFVYSQSKDIYVSLIVPLLIFLLVILSESFSLTNQQFQYNINQQYYTYESYQDNDDNIIDTIDRYNIEDDYDI